MSNRKKGAVQVTPQTFKGPNGQIDTFSEVLAEEAKCGCGIDCCKGIITLWDQDTGKRVEISVASLVVKAKEI